MLFLSIVWTDTKKSSRFCVLQNMSEDETICFYYNKGWNSQTKHLLKRFLNKANINLQFLGPNFPYLTIFDWQFTERLRRKRLRKNIFILTRRIRMGRSRKFIMINCIIKTISIGKIMNNFMKRLLRCSYLPRSPF